MVRNPDKTVGSHTHMTSIYVQEEKCQYPQRIGQVKKKIKVLSLNTLKRINLVTKKEQMTANEKKFTFSNLTLE